MGLVIWTVLSIICRIRGDMVLTKFHDGFPIVAGGRRLGLLLRPLSLSHVGVVSITQIEVSGSVSALQI
ncbi:hypothetical protein GOBAR_AA13427 [Gossypium barbadense]|uniref:Uncharacterized protein n=1 Tax=Gossypium barbadense TaxID=3634 RepID=A0A2P5XV86_GOSBA|nr:hypothetical protein GOBAR_AA13427 [Gossypium barbadense]